MTTIDDKILMGPIKEKLRWLYTHLPDANYFETYFARYLATQLKDEMDPENFLLAAELAFTDLRKGTNGFTGEPIEREFKDVTGLDRSTYLVIRLMFRTRIIDATCPPEFAAAVKKTYKEVSG